MAAALTIHLTSFSYRHSGIPPDEGGHGGGFVFDCRCLPNPHWEPALRALRGDDPPVMAFLAARGEVQAFVGHASALVLQAARRYRDDGRTRLMASCGCTGGRHRSVYVAGRLAEVLRAAGFSVTLRHLDRDRPAAESDAAQAGAATSGTGRP
jgi:RNase adaptor protein for sRNA GlmZ degradation